MIAKNLRSSQSIALSRAFALPFENNRRARGPRQPYATMSSMSSRVTRNNRQFISVRYRLSATDRSSPRMRDLAHRHSRLFAKFRSIESTCVAQWHRDIGVIDHTCRYTFSDVRACHASPSTRAYEDLTRRCLSTYTCLVVWEESSRKGWDKEKAQGRQIAREKGEGKKGVRRCLRMVRACLSSFPFSARRVKRAREKKGKKKQKSKRREWWLWSSGYYCRRSVCCCYCCCSSFVGCRVAGLAAVPMRLVRHGAFHSLFIKIIDRYRLLLILDICVGSQRLLQQKAGLGRRLVGCGRDRAQRIMYTVFKEILFILSIS